MTKQKLKLGTVQETLLIPLYFRAKESERDDAICHDSRAQEIVANLDYDFAKFDSWWLQNDVAIRTEIFDEVVQDFLDRHPQGTIVNLGAGLDGRFYRLDNGLVTWCDLDMPDSIELRSRFYPTSDRNFSIARVVEPVLIDSRKLVRQRFVQIVDYSGIALHQNLFLLC